ncbi:hypothetical protein MY10362_009313 [Beauveria mimosiformis]
MVCCFAAVQYTSCRHRPVFKIDCTRDCASTCEPQELLLEIKALFLCERCLEPQADEKTLDRALSATHAKLVALENQESEEDEVPSHQLFKITASSRKDLEERLASTKLATRLAEARYAEYWTLEVGELVWQLKYGGCEDVEAVERKLVKRMERKPWDLQVVKKSNWTDGTVDSSEESNAATNENNNAGNESVRLGADASASITGSSKIAGQVSIAILVYIAAVGPDAGSDRATRFEYANVAAVFHPGADSSNLDRSRVITEVGDVSIIAGVNSAYFLAAVAASDPTRV